MEDFSDAPTRGKINREASLDPMLVRVHCFMSFELDSYYLYSIWLFDVLRSATTADEKHIRPITANEPIWATDNYLGNHNEHKLSDCLRIVCKHL